MGTTAAVVAGVDLLTGGNVTKKVIGAVTPDPKKPPKPPATLEADTEIAAERVRKQNAAAYGRNDTILTGPQGTLGMMTTGTTTAPKTILGG